MTIVENLQRADLNPMEQARAFERLGREFKMTQEQMAVRTGKDRASVGNFLRLLKLPDSIQGLMEAGELSFGHARALLALDSAEAMTAAAEKVMALAMSVRQTETYVQGLMNPEGKRGRPKRRRRRSRCAGPECARGAGDAAAAAGAEGADRGQEGQGAGDHRVLARVEDFDAILGALGEMDSCGAMKASALGVSPAVC